MAKIAGRQVEIGIGIEATAGTAVAATDYLKWDSFTMQGVSEKKMLDSARGVRNKSSNSIIMKKYGKGDLACSATVDNAPYLFGMLLGSVSSATAAGETTVYDHTITVQNANASMKTATFLVKQGGVQTERYTNVVIEELDLTIDKDFAELKATLLGGFPDIGTITSSYTQDTMFSKNQLAVQFGATLTAAGSATATPLVNLTVKAKNNVQVEDAFLSGSNTPVAGGFIAGPFEATGSYTLQFADTTELAKYQANTKNALIATLTGAAIGTSSNEKIVVKLGRLVLTKEPLEYNLDGLVYLKQEFTVEYDGTDKEMQVIVTNTNAGTNY